MAGELEWSYRHCSRGRERCTENSLLQVSIQPSRICVILYNRREKIADLVPVDIPINLAIAAAWKIVSQHPQLHPCVQLHQWIHQPHQVGAAGDHGDGCHQEVSNGECTLVSWGVLQGECLAQYNLPGTAKFLRV